MRFILLVLLGALSNYALAVIPDGCRSDLNRYQSLNEEVGNLKAGIEFATMQKVDATPAQKALAASQLVADQIKLHLLKCMDN